MLIAAKTIDKVQRDGTGVETGVHVKMLPVEAHLHAEHTPIENIAAARRERTAVVGKVPLHAGCEIKGRGQIKSTLNKRRLPISNQLEREMAPHLERIVPHADKHPFRAIERQVEKVVTLLPGLHAHQRQARLIPFAQAVWHYDIGTRRAHVVPVGLLVNQRQPVGGLIGHLRKIVGHVRIEQAENVLLLPDVHAAQAVAGHGAQAR